MRLVDCFVKPLAYTAYIVGLSGDMAVSMPQVSRIIRRMLDESAKMADLAGFSQGEFDEARFAVCAWIDEAILCSSLPECESWLGELLQRRFYSTNKAGEEFYLRMEALNEESNQVRDVFYYCLALGFKGRYFSPAMEHELEKIKKDAYSRFCGQNVMLMPNSLLGFFTESYPLNPVQSPGKLPRFAFSFATVCMILVPLLILAATYSLYTGNLDSILSNVIQLEFK